MDQLSDGRRMPKFSNPFRQLYGGILKVVSERRIENCSHNCLTMTAARCRAAAAEVGVEVYLKGMADYFDECVGGGLIDFQTEAPAPT